MKSTSPSSIGVSGSIGASGSASSAEPLRSARSAVPSDNESGPQLSDRALVHAVREGEQHAFAQLVHRYQARLLRLALHMVRDRALAEDVVQETLVRTLRALGQYDGRSEPFTWVYRICVNLSLNALRSRRVHARASSLDDDRLAAATIEDQSPDSRSPETQAVQRERFAGLCAGVDQLSESLRVTLILVCIDGLSHDDAAQVLGVTEGTIAWRIHEARRRLRDHLAAGGWNEVE